MFFIKNSRILILFIGLIIITGINAIYSLPIIEDPQITNKFAVITTHYQGISAEKIEVMITSVLEKKLRNITEIELIKSISRIGQSLIVIKLNEEIKKNQPIWAKIRNYISEHQYLLPKQARNSNLNENIGYAYTLILGMYWQQGNHEKLATLNQYAKALNNQLALISGSQFSHLYGEQSSEIIIELDADKINYLQLSPQKIITIINQSDNKLSVGKIENNRLKANIQIADTLHSISQIQNIPIKISAHGSIIRLQDVATIKRQTKKPKTHLALIDGKEGIILAIKMNSNTRIDQWQQQVNQTIVDFKKNVPTNLKIQRLFNQADYTNDKLVSLIKQLITGLLIIFFVLLITLGLQNAIIVSLSLPLVMLFTLAIMKLVNLPIHQMSITGIVVAIGIMVDNAIVITSAIMQEKQSRLSSINAIKKTLHHYWLPLLGATITTILAFTPIALMPGTAGEFINGIAISVIFSLITSYIIAHTIVAKFAGQLNYNNINAWWQTGVKLPKLVHHFISLLHYGLLHPIRTTLVISALPLLGFFYLTHMTEQFFPSADRNMFYIEVYFEPKNSFDYTLQQVKRIDSELKKFSDIKQSNWMIGNHFPSFYYNLSNRGKGDSCYAQAMIQTISPMAADKLMPVLQKQLQWQFHEAKFLVRKLNQGTPFDAPIEIHISGHNFDTLANIGEQISHMLYATNNIVHTQSTLVGSSPILEFTLDSDITLKSGLRTKDIANQLNIATLGIQAASMLDHEEIIPINVHIKSDYTQNALEQFNFISPLGTNIPISTLGKFTLLPQEHAIPRRNHQRVNTIEGYTPADVLPANVLKEIIPKLNNLDLPMGYSIRIEGENAKRHEAITQLFSNVSLIIILLFAILVFIFNSYRLTFIIVTSAIQSIGLGLLGVYIFGYPFGFTVIIALLGLVGIAINAAIIILAEITKNKDDPTSDKAIINAVNRCGRHIISTTITTIGGFLPLIIAGGEFWPPFAIAISGGTFLTSILSLIWVPTMYKLLIKKPINNHYQWA